MNILPLKGTDRLVFGTHKGEIEKLLGQPDSVENPNAQDDTSSEIYQYECLGLELYFDKDSGFRLWGISVTDRAANLDGIAPIGLSENEILNAFSDLELDVHDGEFKEYVLPKLGIEFYLKDDYVQRIMINPDLEDYCDRFSEQA